MTHSEILDFWFTELSEDERFNGGVAVDEKIRERFSDVHAAAAAGELWKWRVTPEGALAEVIVLDQFSRNLYRGKRKAFASDSQALVLAQAAIEKGFDTQLATNRRLFLYMPFMHSESKLIHVEALRLFAALGNEGSLTYEHIHKDIIDRFGRYPHRNKQLGRKNTPEEDAYLVDTKHSFFKS